MTDHVLGMDPGVHSDSLLTVHALVDLTYMVSLSPPSRRAGVPYLWVVVVEEVPRVPVCWHGGLLSIVLPQVGDDTTAIERC